MMDTPLSPDNKPAVIKLGAGSHFWCACGHSENQPFCDGAHKGTAIAPIKFVLEEEKTIALCNCKKTNSPPFCDGTHSSL